MAVHYSYNSELFSSKLHFRWFLSNVYYLCTDSYLSAGHTVFVLCESEQVTVLSPDRASRRKLLTLDRNCVTYVSSALEHYFIFNLEKKKTPVSQT